MPALSRLQPSGPLRARLLLIAASALLPLALFSAVALYYTALDKRRSVENAMVETVRALSGAVDSELNRVAAAAQVLAHSPLLERKDFAGFHRLASAVLAEQPLWATIAVFDADGRYVLNLQRPYGSELPGQVSEPESVERARALQRPQFGNLILGKVSGQQVFTVRVPMVRAGETQLVISVAVKPQAMLTVVRRQQIPDEAIVAIIDGSGRIVARSRRQDEFLGRSITPDLREAIDLRRQGFATLFTLEGQKTYAAFTRSAESGWSVALGLPAEALDAPLYRSYGLLAAGVVLSLLLGAGTALFLARRLARPIQELANAARAMGAGEIPPIRPAGIPELDSVASALARSAEARQQSELAREAVLHREREARAAAERLNRQKDEFLAMLGHELRNPLSVVSNGAQVLLAQGAGDPKARETVERVARQASHMAHLLNDLLESSRVVAGKIDLAAVPLDLGAEVRAVVELFAQSRQLPAHRVRARCESAWINGDRHRVEQIITNLLGNALKYSAAETTVHVEVAVEPPHALLCVSDEGVGMDEETRARVFELFFQGRGRGEPAGGLGVGLTLVRRLVELHGGEVQAHSAGPGQGSTFTVRFPLIAAPPAAEPKTAMASAAPMLVALVEDNDDARATMRRLLELKGHRVLEAADGAAGAALVLEQRPPLALIDIAMPGVDGYECARRIRARPEGAGTLLVALTGYGLEADRDRAREAGFHQHLTKPVSVEAIEAILAQARSRSGR